MRKTGLLAAALLSVAMASPVMAQMSAEDQIAARQGAFQFAGWNMGKIKAQAIDGDVAYNQQQMLAAANSIAAVGNSGLGALFGPGTAMDKNEGTRLKPEFFEQPDKAREVAINFAQASAKLQEVATNGDQAALVAQFSEVGKTCKACHDAFRAE